MTKQNFQQITRDELRVYIVFYPPDEEAIQELFVHCSNSSANAKDIEDGTALMIAASEEDIEILQLLLDANNENSLIHIV